MWPRMLLLDLQSFFVLFQSYVLMLYSTLSRSQYDFTLPQVSFTSDGYHKHVTLTFNPTVRDKGLAYIWCLKVFFVWENISFIVRQTLLIQLVWCVLSPQRKVPDQDVAQGSYIALPLTLLLLLAAYNHEKVNNHHHLLQRVQGALLILFSWPYHGFS